MNNLFHKVFVFFLLSVFSASFISAQTDREYGIKLYETGDYKSAAQFFKNATKTNPSDFQAWYFLGASQFKQDKLKDAEKSFRKSVELNPKEAQPYVGLAYAFLMKNKLIESQREAQKALELNKQNAETHYILGVIYFKNGVYNSAYEKAKKAIELNPNLANAYILKSESLTSSFAQQTGTIIKHPNSRSELLKEAVVDLEKYINLSAANKNITFYREYLESLKFFAEYYNRPETNLPPASEPNMEQNSNLTPLNILSKPRASYTDKARQVGITGSIRLLVGFSSEGKIKHILLIKPLGFGLDQEAIIAARGIKFEPATKDGKSISVVKMVDYNFTLY